VSGTVHEDLSIFFVIAGEIKLL